MTELIIELLTWSAKYEIFGGIAIVTIIIELVLGVIFIVRAIDAEEPIVVVSITIGAAITLAILFAIEWRFKQQQIDIVYRMMRDNPGTVIDPDHLIEQLGKLLDGAVGRLNR